jgi:hypothetical protein
MEPSLEELRKNYEHYDDNKLIRIATEEATSLRPEALVLIKQIIEERGLATDILNAVDAQIKPLNQHTLTTYTELLRNQPCPVCNSTANRLNATLTATVMSFIIFTNYTKELKIACPDCLDKKSNNAILKSALIGWWGLPWGIIRTVQSLILNSKMKKQNRLPEANDLLKAYVVSNVGRVEASKNNPEKLQELITHIR